MHLSSSSAALPRVCENGFVAPVEKAAWEFLQRIFAGYLFQCCPWTGSSGTHIFRLSIDHSRTFASQHWIVECFQAHQQQSLRKILEGKQYSLSRKVGKKFVAD